MITVLGASGFIGSHIASECVRQKLSSQSPLRHEIPDAINGDLGDVIYCLGLTSDFRTKPLATSEAHVGILAQILKSARFNSLLYLSSTRVYEGAESTTEESWLKVNPNTPEHIFNLTKLAGEACCLSQDNPNIRIARVSNVLGDDYKSNNFLFSVIREILLKDEVELRTTPDSAKDYIWIDDVVDLLLKIARGGRHRLYNVASGINVTNEKWMNEISLLTGARIRYADSAEKKVFQIISTQRITEEFKYNPTDVLPKLSTLIEEMRLRQ